jgi:hypothetical protein
MSKFLFAGIIFSTICGVSSMAETNVYSENVVGLYKVDSPAEQRIMLANQLQTTNDVLSNVLPGPYADGTTFFYYNSGFSVSSWDTDANAWTANFPLTPGEGGFFYSQVHQTLTFLGEVPQGSLTNTFVSRNKVMRAPIPPIAQRLSDMGIPAEDGDVAFSYHSSYAAAAWDTDANAWTVDFVNKVGESFFYFKQGTATNWVINFTVQ